MNTIQQLINVMQKYPEAVQRYAEDGGDISEIKAVTKSGKGKEELLTKILIGIWLHSPLVVLVAEVSRRMKGEAVSPVDIVRTI